MLSINCTAFVTGLQAAKSADKAAESKRHQIALHIQTQFDQVAHKANGGNGFKELNSDEYFRYYF